MEIIKLNDLSRWAELGPDEAIKFEAGAPRKVRLQLNCRHSTMLYIVHADALTGEVAERMLCTVPQGLSLVEFVTGGNPFHIGTDATSPVLYYTAEMEQSALETLDPEIFTKIAHRRARNPELEQMMFIMNQNIERRLSIMDADHQRQLAALKEKGIENGEVVRTGGDIHVGAPAQREKLDEAPEASGEGGEPLGGRRAPRKGASPATDGSASDVPEAGGEA